MKINNQVMVGIAASIAMTAALGKSYATTDHAHVTNNNIYGLSRTGQCILADPDDLANGCVVSMSGSVCYILIEVNGVTEVSQAFKSPIAGAMCSLTLKAPY